MAELWDTVDGDLYEVLGVSRSHSADQLQAAWRAAAKKFHPDTGGDPAQFRQAQTAYQVLSDPTTRARYDAYTSPRPQTVRYVYVVVRPPPPREAYPHFYDTDPHAEPEKLPKPSFWVVLLIATMFTLFVLAYLVGLLGLFVIFATMSVGAALGMRRTGRKSKHPPG